jgi:hypothetical protein
MVSAMGFDVGQVVVRRYFRALNGLIIVQCCRVVADDERGLLLWMPTGSRNRRIMTVDGRRYEEISRVEWDAAEKVLAKHPTRRHSLLMLMPPAPRAVTAWHSVSWFFDQEGPFVGWYVNLEAPATRWSAGLDLVDHDLDVWVNPDRAWRWKDEADFEAATREGLDWSADEAVEIRAEGERLAKRAEAGEYPFDGTWCDFRPDPAWRLPELPAGWDRPRCSDLPARRR